MRWWGFHTDDRDAADPGSLDALREALTPRTKIVAACHASNPPGAVSTFPRRSDHSRGGVERVSDHRGRGGVRAAQGHVGPDWGVDWYCFVRTRPRAARRALRVGSRTRRRKDPTTICRPEIIRTNELGRGLATSCARESSPWRIPPLALGRGGGRAGGGRDAATTISGSRGDGREPRTSRRSCVRALEEALRAARDGGARVASRCWAIRILDRRSDATVRVPTISFVPTSANVSPAAPLGREDSVAIRNATCTGCVCAKIWA